MFVENVSSEGSVGFFVQILVLMSPPHGQGGVGHADANFNARGACVNLHICFCIEIVVRVVVVFFRVALFVLFVQFAIIHPYNQHMRKETRPTCVCMSMFGALCLPSSIASRMRAALVRFDECSQGNL